MVCPVVAVFVLIALVTGCAGGPSARTGGGRSADEGGGAAESLDNADTPAGAAGNRASLPSPPDGYPAGVLTAGSGHSGRISLVSAEIYLDLGDGRGDGGGNGRGVGRYLLKNNADTTVADVAHYMVAQELASMVLVDGAVEVMHRRSYYNIADDSGEATLPEVQQADGDGGSQPTATDGESTAGNGQTETGKANSGEVAADPARTHYLVFGQEGYPRTLTVPYEVAVFPLNFEPGETKEVVTYFEALPGSFEEGRLYRFDLWGVDSFYGEVSMDVYVSRPVDRELRSNVELAPLGAEALPEWVPEAASQLAGSMNDMVLMLFAGPMNPPETADLAGLGTVSSESALGLFQYEQLGMPDIRFWVAE